jgi:hypothetical protein
MAEAAAVKTTSNPGRLTVIEWEAAGTRREIRLEAAGVVTLTAEDAVTVAVLELPPEAGRALMRGLADLYQCEVIEHG